MTRYAIDEFMDNLSVFFQTDDQLEIVQTWDVGADLVQACASNGIPDRQIRFPIETPRALDFWESFYLTAIRLQGSKDCRLVVRAYPEKLAWQIILLRKKK